MTERDWTKEGFSGPFSLKKWLPSDYLLLMLKGLQTGRNWAGFEVDMTSFGHINVEGGTCYGCVAVMAIGHLLQVPYPSAVAEWVSSNAEAVEKAKELEERGRGSALLTGWSQISSADVRTGLQVSQGDLGRLEIVIDMLRRGNLVQLLDHLTEPKARYFKDYLARRKSDGRPWSISCQAEIGSAEPKIEQMMEELKALGL